MADKAISELTAASSAADSDELVLNQSAGGGSFNTKRISVSAFKGGLPFAGLASPTFAGAINLTDVIPGALTNCITNNSIATNAYSGFKIDNGVSSGWLAHYGNQFTTSGMSRQNGTKVIGNGAGGLTLEAVSQPIFFGISNVESGRIDANRYWLLGYMSSQGSHKLQVNGSSYLGGGATAADTITAPRFSTATGTTANAALNTWINTYTLPGAGFYAFWATQYTGVSWIGGLIMQENGNGAFKQLFSSGNTMEMQLSGAIIQVRNTVYSNYPVSWGVARLG